MKGKKKKNVNKKVVFIITGVFLIVSLIACIIYIIFDKIVIEKELYKNIDNYLESNLSSYEDKDNDDYIQVILNDKKRIIQKQRNHYQEIYTYDDVETNRFNPYIGTYKDRLYFHDGDSIYYRDINNNFKKYFVIKNKEEFFDSKFNGKVYTKYGFIVDNKMYISLEFEGNINNSVYSLNLDNLELTEEFKSNFDFNIGAARQKFYLSNDKNKLFYMEDIPRPRTLYEYDLITKQNKVVFSLDKNTGIEQFSYSNGYIAYVEKVYGSDDDWSSSLNLYNVLTKKKTKVTKLYFEETDSYLPLYDLINGKYLYYVSAGKICQYNIYDKNLEKCHITPDDFSVPLKTYFYVVDDKIVLTETDGMYNPYLIDLDRETKYNYKGNILYNDEVYNLSDEKFKTNINLLDGSVFDVNGPLKTNRHYT